jgi:hypothetical protein
MTEKKKYEIYYSSRKSFHFSNCIVGTLLSIWQTLEIVSIYSTQQEKQIQLLRNSILKVCLRNLLDLNLITRCHENKLYFQCRGVQKGKRYTTEIPCWNCETNRLPRYYLKNWSTMKLLVVFRLRYFSFITSHCIINHK